MASGRASGGMGSRGDSAAAWKTLGVVGVAVYTGGPSHTIKKGLEDGMDSC